MTNSLREIKDQLSPGSTLDGNRLERMLRDLIARINNIQPRDVRRRWVESTIVFGGQQTRPLLGTKLQPSLPWMPIYNDANSLLPGTTMPIDGMTNPWRIKGTAVANIDPTGQLGTGMQWALSPSLAITKPAILSGISLTMLVDREFPNDFVYGADPPPNRTTGGPLNDMTLSVEIDNPFTPMDRRQTAVEFQRTNLRLDAWKLNRLPVPSFPDYAPVFPSNAAPNGVCLHAEGLNIPLPRSSKGRVNVVLPEYDAIWDAGWAKGSADHKPWRNTCFTLTLTILEECQ